MKFNLTWAASGVLIGGMAAGLLGLGGHGGISLAAASVARQIAPASAQQAVGIRFTPQPVANGARPVLPNGQQAVSEQQATQVAMRDTDAVTAQGLLPNVQVIAQYGILSDDQLAKILPSGGKQPLFQDRPVWLVTFAGPGLSVPLEGAPPLPGQTPVDPKQAPAFHEENVVVDAATGEYLETYAYR